MRRIIVCGSRRWSDRDRIADALHDLCIELGGDLSDVVIVHGNAAGADKIAHHEAHKLGLRTEPHPAEWQAYGKRAGPIRNAQMAEAGAILCLAFWDGLSTGTAHMLDQAERHGITTRIVPDHKKGPDA